MNVENFKNMIEILKYLLHVIITLCISFPEYLSFYSNTFRSMIITVVVPMYIFILL